MLASAISYSQVSVTATASDSTVFCGTCTELVANGTLPTSFESFDFEDGWPADWNVPACGVLSNPCGPGDGAYAWMGSATSAPRTLETGLFNVSCGGTVCFDFRMAPPGAPAPCEDPDQPNEGVFFQYSINGGATWVTIDYFDPTTYGSYSYDTWESYCFTMPLPAHTNNTMFRWMQASSSGYSFDHWGIDNVHINSTNCGFYYNWNHVPGFPDSNTSVVCPIVNMTYTVAWTNGFNDSVVTSIDIDVEFSELELSFDSNSTIDSCGGCLQINGNIINPGPVYYLWNWHGPGVTNINDSTVIVCPLNDSWYYASISANGCKAVDSIYVDVNIPVSDTAFKVSDNMCSPALMNFSNTLDGSNCRYTFYGPDGSVYLHVGCEPFSHDFEAYGLYDVMFLMVTPDGCQLDTLYENFFEVYQTPEASFHCIPGEGTIIENLIQMMNTTVGGDNFYWEFGDGEVSYDKFVSHEYNEVGYYIIDLYVDTEHGCNDSTSGSILIKDDIYVYIPNTFTPDGNEYNNTFKPIISRHDIYDYHLVVYNRWGEIMFESHNSDYGWDGTYGGQIVDDGVYVWTLRVGLTGTAEVKEYKGHVVLLK